MVDCYHAEACFSDPVFTTLQGPEIGAMWSMFCDQAKTLEIEVFNIKADKAGGQALWTASYVFGKPARLVHNRINAIFEFQNGKIIKHSDHFNLWKWSRMALGPLGLILGWHPRIQNKIRHQAQANLIKFIKRSEFA